MKFSDAPAVNAGRQIEADMAKFICLAGMVIVHCFDIFVSFSETESGVQFLFLYVLNALFGAGTFMFCMGVGVAYGRNSTPERLMRRGARLFLLGYLLNLACAASYLLLKDVSLFVTYLLGLDILQFAGLALILFGFLRRLKCPDWGVGAVAIALSLIGSFVRGVDLGSPAANIFCGLFVGSFDYEWMTGGIFPLCNWFIFVAAGELFAKYLLRPCADKDRLYRRIGAGSAVVLAVYMLIAIPKRLGMMGSVLSFHHIALHEAVVCIAGALFALSVYHFLSKLLPGKARALIESVSRNISVIYCIQWVALAWMVSVWALCGKKVFSDGAILLIGLAVFALSAAAAQLYRRIKRKKA